MVPNCGRRPTEIDKLVGRRIRDFRRRIGSTPSMIADRLGISVESYQLYEKGTFRVAPAHLVKLAAEFALPLSAFFLDAPAVERAEVDEIDEIIITRAKSISYLPVMVMEHEKLVEKAALRADCPQFRVKYRAFNLGALTVSSLLDRSAHFAAGVTPAFLKLWDQTYCAESEIRMIRALASTPLYLCTRNPFVQSIGDFSSSDRINVIYPGYLIRQFCWKWQPHRSLALKNVRD